jgi:hypothetical protein
MPDVASPSRTPVCLRSRGARGSARAGVCTFAALVLLAPSAVRAQQRDSARAGVPPRRAPAPIDTAPPAGDSLSRPPISPRSAFLRSLALPGWGQAKLDRGIAGGLFATADAISLAMVIQSRRSLAQAKRLKGDSVIVGYQNASPSTGNPGTPVYAPASVGGRVRARRQHWTALLIFTHLLAGADAFIAAHLWDLPTEVSMRSDGRSAGLAARVVW